MLPSDIKLMFVNAKVLPKIDERQEPVFPGLFCGVTEKGYGLPQNRSLDGTFCGRVRCLGQAHWVGGSLPRVSSQGGAVATMN